GTRARGAAQQLHFLTLLRLARLRSRHHSQPVTTADPAAGILGHRQMLAPNDDINAVLNVKPGGGGRRWFTAKRAILVVLALVVAVGLWWWIGSGSESRTVYTTAEGTRGGLTVTISATGTVEPINQV